VLAHYRAAERAEPPGEIRIERFGWTFCPGDKVMQIENDYESLAQVRHRGCRDLTIVSGRPVSFKRRMQSFRETPVDRLDIQYRHSRRLDR
jgi:hypothetical protein